MSDTNWLIVAIVNAFVVLGAAVAFLMIYLRGGLAGSKRAGKPGTGRRLQLFGLILGLVMLFAMGLTFFIIRTH